MLNKGNPDKRPEYWGGYDFIPYSFEFWTGENNRLNKENYLSFLTIYGGKLFAAVNNSLIIRIFQLKSWFMIPIDLSIYPHFKTQN